MKVSFLDLKSQYERIRESVDARTDAVIGHGQFIMGPEVRELEKLLEKFSGARHCVACSSGTDALLMAMLAQGIGGGDEVVTTPFSFIATAETISLLGARPVFVDIDPKTFNIAPELIEAAITPATKAIIAVSLFGQCADMDAIRGVAEQHHLAVIEDGAQSFGATYKGRPSCNLGVVGCTSFFPAKPLGCYGDGGACFTNDDEMAAAFRQIRVHGQDCRYHHVRIGINGRMDTLQAAIIVAKMNIFEDEIARRQTVAAQYDEMLGGSVVTPYLEPHNTSVYAQYTILCADRDEVAESLQSAGVPTAVHYPTPLHLQPAFAELGYGKGAFPHAEFSAQHVLSLPMHPYLSQEQIDIVTNGVLEAVAKQLAA